MKNTDISGNKTGVVYVAFGYEYLVMALNSLRTLNEQNPDIPASIVTNMPISNDKPGDRVDNRLNIKGQQIFDEIYYVDEDDQENRNYKTDLANISPYDRTLYLDSDTEVLGDIQKGFDFLDYFNIALVLSPYPVTTMSVKWDGDIHVDNISLEDTSRWNGGVFFFDSSDNTKEFFKTWNQKYRSFGYKKDQYSLLNAAYTTQVRIMSLDLSWNANEKCRGIDESIRSDTKIFHYSWKPMYRLRRLEEEIGDLILDCDPQRKSMIRSSFRESYSYKNISKNILKSHSYINSTYRFIRNTLLQRGSNSS